MECVNREHHFIIVQIVSCKSDEKNIISLLRLSTKFHKNFTTLGEGSPFFLRIL